MKVKVEYNRLIIGSWGLGYYFWVCCCFFIWMICSA